MRFAIQSLGPFAAPMIVIAALLLWQRVFVPRFIPNSHYQVLGVKPDSTTDDITHAYRQLASSWRLQNGEKGAIAKNMIQIQHAYEILSDPLRRRDYDHFGVDELQEIAKNLQKHVGDAASEFRIPLWEPFNYEPLESGTTSLTLENFRTLLEGKEAWLIQIYSLASRRSQKYAAVWEEISAQMDGVARVGRVELGEIQVATSFADKNKASGYSFFRYGLPALVAFPPDCRNWDCIARYSEEITIDGVVNWMATHVLRFPRILYYSPQTLVTDFIRKSGSHKVKVVIFSTTGERAAPFLRQAAKDFWDYAVFGLVLWREENATLWESMLGLESAPAVVFLKDPGIGPVIHYGKMNSSTFQILMKEHKTHVLPQLRSVTAADLGCDEVGYSRAGKEIHTWYCVIVAGRPGFELSQARGVLRAVQDNLTNEVVPVENEGESLPLFWNAASAFKEKRLTLAWLDGETQKQVCYFYLSSETVYETCGPKNYPELSDLPRVFLVRYRRHPNDREKFLKKKKRFNTVWHKLLENDEDIASQIVAKYNGSMDVPEIVSWVSEMIKEGDAQDLLFYMKRAPSLVPEESKPAWLVNARNYVSVKSEGLVEKCRRFILGLLDYAKDPNFTPILVLIAAIYAGGVFLKSKQNSRQDQQQVPDRTGKNDTIEERASGAIEQ